MIEAAVDILLDLGGGLAALLVARDSPNFGVVRGMMATIVLVSLVATIALVVWRRRTKE